MHFQSKLHNNAILTGSVDSYCLVCDNYLRSEDEAFMHTEKPIHKKNMGAVMTVEKFSAERIIKVKKGYYCPFCNILLSTTTKVTIHIGDTNHQEKKGTLMLTCIGNNIIAFDDVAITMDAWHGLIDDTCVICNTEFDENDKHRADHSHILRLVQSKCEFGDKYLYRKVDEDSFFCLICGSVFSMNEKLNHHENISHKNHYKSSRELKNKIPPQTKNTTQTAALKPDPIVTSNGESKIPVAAKQNDKVETKKMEVKIDKDHIKNMKHEVKSTLSPDRGPTVLRDGKLKVALSTDKETATLFKNTVHSHNIAEKNQKKPENVNGAIANDKSGEAVNKTLEKEKVSDILDRVDEYQKEGVNIDFTWERARCTRCNVYVQFDSPAIQGHIEKHKIIKEFDKIELNLDLNKQAKKLDTNEAKADINKTDNGFELKTDMKKVDNNVGPMTNTKTQLKSEINDVKTDTNKIDNGIVPKLDPKKHVKKSDKSKEVKIDTKKTDAGVEPKPDSKKTENGVEPKTEIQKTNNGLEPKTDTKKINNKMDNPKPDSKKQKKSDNDLKSDTKKELEAYAKENNLVIMPNEAYCPLCKVGFTMNIVAMNDHTNLSSHKDKTPRQNEELENRVLISKYVKTFMRLESSQGSEVCLNNKYILRQHSFHCIVMDEEGYKCMLCDADFTKTRQLLTQHMTGPEHRNKMSMCKIVTSLPEEFIRETTADVYHCGYCNEIFEGWTELQNHLSHSKHLYARRHAQWILERCHSVIRNARLMQVSSMHTINYA